VGESVGFLVNYYESLIQAETGPQRKEDDKRKGKAAMVTTSTPENTEGALKPKERWVVPQGGWVKVNTDAGFCPLSVRASTGVVIRDDTGKVFLTAWKSLGHCASPEEAEAEAYLQGVRLVAEWVGKPMYAELDCLSLVRVVQVEHEARSTWAGVIYEIKRVGNLLPDCRYTHVCREANMVAHMLASHALRSQDSAIR
jgi:hypothetical protein